jgi:hypothetical protein
MLEIVFSLVAATARKFIQGRDAVSILNQSKLTILASMKQTHKSRDNLRL